MKCKKCGKEGAKYVERKKRDSTVRKLPNGKSVDVRFYPVRTNFQAIHKKCGFEGKIW